jgi:hypothetical protein
MEKIINIKNKKEKNILYHFLFFRILFGCGEEHHTNTARTTTTTKKIET